MHLVGRLSARPSTGVALRHQAELHVPAPYRTLFLPHISCSRHTLVDNLPAHRSGPTDCTNSARALSAAPRHRSMESTFCAAQCTCILDTALLTNLRTEITAAPAFVFWEYVFPLTFPTGAEFWRTVPRNVHNSDGEPCDEHLGPAQHSAHSTLYQTACREHVGTRTLQVTSTMLNEVLL